MDIKKTYDKEKIKVINKQIEECKDMGISRKDISDGWHTFDELYYHRMMLFAVILNQNKERAWKARKHHDGTIFGDDSFICGIDTPSGQYTYHYNLKYWDMFDVREYQYAPEYDGHKPKDITRLLSIVEREASFKLANYCQLLVLDENDELVVSIEDNKDNPIKAFKGYKIVLNPIDTTKTLEEYF